MTNFRAISVRIGEVRFEDLKPQLQGTTDFDVLAIDNNGCPTRLHLRLTEKWGGSWQSAIECPCCGAAARVLAVLTNTAACGKCHHRSTKRDNRKNTKEWAKTGKLFNEFMISAARRGPKNRHRSKVLANRLRSRALRQAIEAITVADQAITASHEALEESRA